MGGVGEAWPEGWRTQSHHVTCTKGSLRRYTSEDYRLVLKSILRPKAGGSLPARVLSLTVPGLAACSAEQDGSWGSGARG